MISFSIAPSCSSPSSVGRIFGFTINSVTLAYVLYSYGFIANSTSATLTFAIDGENGGAGHYWLLDSISVNYTNTSTNVLVNGGFETGTFAGWTQYCNTNANCGGTNLFGQITTNPCQAGSYCYVDKCDQGGSVDYLIQSFPTVIGDYYIVSFYVRAGLANNLGSWFMDVMLT